MHSFKSKLIAKIKKKKKVASVSDEDTTYHNEETETIDPKSSHRESKSRKHHSSIDSNVLTCSPIDAKNITNVDYDQEKSHHHDKKRKKRKIVLIEPTTYGHDQHAPKSEGQAVSKEKLSKEKLSRTKTKTKQKNKKEIVVDINDYRAKLHVVVISLLSDYINTDPHPDEYGYLITHSPTKLFTIISKTMSDVEMSHDHTMHSKLLCETLEEVECFVECIGVIVSDWATMNLKRKFLIACINDLKYCELNIDRLVFNLDRINFELFTVISNIKNKINKTIQSSAEKYAEFIMHKTNVLNLVTNSLFTEEWEDGECRIFIDIKRDIPSIINAKNTNMSENIREIAVGYIVQKISYTYRTMLTFKLLNSKYTHKDIPDSFIQQVKKDVEVIRLMGIVNDMANTHLDEIKILISLYENV